MGKTCRHCQSAFEITSGELAFLERVSPIVAGTLYALPPPTLCPACRLQRRFAYRNERFLHRRTCDLTGKSIISLYRPNVPYKVYDKDAWWSDRWDATEHGRAVDFSRPFFAQIVELRRAVPRLGMIMTQDEGNSFTSFSTYTKHCYMCVSCVVNENSYYCYQANDSRDCVDCAVITRCERCYECVHCFGLRESAYCKDCENGSDLFLCQDCRGCSDCIGCKNLVNKRHCIFNRQATPAEVKALRKTLETISALSEQQERFAALALTLPTRASHIVQCENSTGDHLRNCRNARNCFDAMNLEDCANLFPAPGLGMKDCRDCHYSPGSELVYDSVSGMRCQRARFVLHSWDNEDILYTDECFNCKHLFGCIGLRRREYCILNKQYSKEDYEALVPRIVEQMRQSKEWGEFPPAQDSPFAYNESIAQDECPLMQEEALRHGWRWIELLDEKPNVTKIIPAEKLPDSLGDIPDDVTNWAIQCAATKRPFKIIRQELEFYRSMHLPLPRLHPEERYHRRIARRNPRKLWDRNCAKCKQPIATSYAPERPETVYCESCYLKEVY